MAEKGFYSASAGQYWQTMSDPSSEIRNAYPADTVEVPVKPGADYDWDASKSAWTKVAVTPPVPDEVTRLQARVALYNAGKLTEIETAISAADPLTQMAWADAQVLRRASPTVATIAAALSPPMTDAEIDDLFRAAAQVEM